MLVSLFPSKWTYPRKHASVLAQHLSSSSTALSVTLKPSSITSIHTVRIPPSLHLTHPSYFLSVKEQGPWAQVVNTREGVHLRSYHVMRLGRLGVLLSRAILPMRANWSSFPQLRDCCSSVFNRAPIFLPFIKKTCRYSLLVGSLLPFQYIWPISFVTHRRLPCHAFVLLRWFVIMGNTTHAW